MRPETPEAGGRGGLAATRDIGYVFPGKTLVDYSDQLNSAVVAIMAEKKSCVDNLEEILSVGGIDMVQFGPGDYSMSIGKHRTTSFTRRSRRRRSTPSRPALRWAFVQG